MDCQTLEVVDEGKTILVRMNRPEKRNALSNMMKQELTDVARKIDQNSKCACVILTGSGGIFSAGNDISEIGCIEDVSLTEARKLARLGADMCEAWEKLRSLTIAVVNGAAIGGGTSLAVACDFRVLGLDAYFYAPEVELGLTFSWNTLPRLGDLVGPARTKLIGALSRKIDATTALNWGLCEEVAKDPMSSARELALDIAAKPRMAQQMVKESVNRYFQSPNTAYLEQDQILLSLLAGESKILHELKRRELGS
jgi:enoyl-CoA hydratase